MKNVLTFLRTHQPVIYAVLGAVYAALVQQGVIDNSNPLVVLVTSLLGAAGITVLHVRQQSK